MMKHHVAVLPLVLLLCITLTGCDSTPPGTNATVPPGPPPPPGAPPPPLAPETKVGVFAGGIDDLAAGPAAGPPAQSAPAAPPADPNVERVKAQAGVGAKGRSLDAYQGGYLVTPAKAYFAAKERIVFEAQFQHQYNIFKAAEGIVPKDYDDLKAKVLDPYQIKLPPLPQGHRYVWDAATEELQVERPKQQ